MNNRYEEDPESVGLYLPDALCICEDLATYELLTGVNSLHIQMKTRLASGQHL